MAKDNLVGTDEVVVPAVDHHLVIVEIRVIFECVFKRVSAVIIKAEIQHVYLRAFNALAETLLHLPRKDLAVGQTKAPGRAASEHGHPFLTGLFFANCRAAVAQKIYAVLMVKVKVDGQ